MQIRCAKGAGKKKMVSISPRLNPFKKTILVPPPLSGNYISILISSSSTCISINFYFYFLLFFLLRKTLETITEKNNYSLDKLRFEPISKGIINPSIALSLRNIGEERNFERPVNKSEESDRRDTNLFGIRSREGGSWLATRALTRMIRGCPR